MAAPLMVGMTPDVIVEGAYIVRITALDPTTGNDRTEVKVTSAAILANPSEDVAFNIPPSPEMGAYSAGDVS